MTKNHGITFCTLKMNHFGVKVCFKKARLKNKWRRNKKKKVLNLKLSNKYVIL